MGSLRSFSRRFLPQRFTRDSEVRGDDRRSGATEPESRKGSLAYRKSKDEIWRQQVPEKYRRLIDLIPGNRIFELGSAEGVLALLLAQRKEKVVALEKHKGRHEEAQRLQASWKQQGADVDRCEMVRGDIADRLDLLEQIDTFVAVRSLYHLRENVEFVLNEVGERVENVVLCGNKNRARRFFEGVAPPGEQVDPFDYYASKEGMTSALEKAGYAILKTIDDGDPIVLARKNLNRSSAA